MERYLQPMLIRTTNGGSKARVEHSAAAHQQPSAVTECTTNSTRCSESIIYSINRNCDSIRASCKLQSCKFKCNYMRKCKYLKVPW